MPELPEVEVVRAGLEPAVTGALVSGVEVLEARSLRRHAGDARDFEGRLVGRRITAAVRRGKFLWLPLEPGSAEPQAVLAHLGMSGQLLLRAPEAEADRQLRVRLHLEHPARGHAVVAFADQRIFGSLAVDRLEPTADGAAGGRGSPAALVPAQVAHIARDPLDPAFDDARFTSALARRRTGIKRALLDQTLISGIGNIYADESLWAARLHPETPTKRLRPGRVQTLLAEVRLVLELALAEGGTSFDAQYVNVNGASGYFSHSLRAYGQQGRPCPRCGTPIVREAFMNRSSHRCPRCQRRPRASVVAAGVGSSEQDARVSFQAYLDAVEAETGLTPRQLMALAHERGLDAPGTKAGEILAWLKDEHGLARGHGMAMVHVIRKGERIDPKHVGAAGSHRDGSDVLWLDGVATKPS